ncbi:MAG: AI-2E family transporter [Prevotella sp.]|nr:AI-2E family transporter [Prevotella sp.]
MLDKTITFDRFVRLMLGMLFAAALLYITNYLSNVLLPFFIGWLLAYLLYPAVIFVQHRMHVKSRVLSILITLIVVLSVIGGITYLIVPSMIEQFEKLGYLVNKYLHEVTNISNFPIAIRDWITNNHEQINRFFKDSNIPDTLRKVMPQVFAVITQTANIIISIVASLIALLYMFFILLDYETLAAGMIKIFPKKNRPFWRALIDDAERELNSYIRGQGLVALCIGVLFCIGFTIIGFPMAIGMGIMIGVMSLIPYVHSLALIPIVFLSLLKAADTGTNFWVILLSALTVFAIIQLITDMVLTPKIMGKAMGLNPAVLLLSLSVWGALLGFIGLIIALPLTTLLIAYYQRYVTKETSEPEEKPDKKQEQTQQISI